MALKVNRVELEIPHGIELKGVWDIHAFDASRITLTDEELQEAFSEQRKLYYEGKSPFKFPYQLKPKASRHYNLVVNGMFNTIIQRILGTQLSTQDLQARKLAIGTGNTAPTINDTQLVQEFYRAGFTDVIQVSNKAILSLFINRLTANGGYTDAVTDAGNTTSTFLVDPGTANRFAVGNRIRVTTASQFNFVNVTAVDVINDLITVSPALADIPVTGNLVVQCWAEAGTFGNGNTGDAPNTGTLFNRVNGLDFVKDDQEVVVIEVSFTLTSP